MSGNDGVSAPETRARGTGRPAFKPTDTQRQIAVWLKEGGASNDLVAKAIGISRNTLAKHFKDELAVKPVPSADQQLDFGGEAHKVADVAPDAPGRPEFEPTQRQRDDVQLWAADGWTEIRMARQLGIAKNTLRKHFAEDIEFGADRVRTAALRDLKRGSAQGKTAASRTLLELSGTAPPPRGEDSEPPAPVLGKKAQADVAAQTAEIGTDWADLVH